MCYVYFEVKVWYKMYCCKKNSCLCLMLTLFRCPLITENNHLLCDPELSNVTRNCQIYFMSLDDLKIGIYKLKDFMNCIKVKRNNFLNSTGRVPEFGRFWRFSNIFSIIYEQICLKIGLTTGEPLIY